MFLMENVGWGNGKRLGDFTKYTTRYFRPLCEQTRTIHVAAASANAGTVWIQR